ncbi:hypothetical protein [Nocardia sp. CNY236]|uniref:hypothetical protein n=1 Tax=Nocardia sp. CNY236 TaxID=1169152 RepID=UPI00040F622F|nr:hypothetical protein [Nocardia sp. CNY236]
MPKRTSDVSLHVHVTPETLEQVVATVRAVVDDHLIDHDVFAWRFTVPVDTDNPTHLALENHHRASHLDDTAHNRQTYEIVLGLVGSPDQLADRDMAILERELLQNISMLGRSKPGESIPLSIRSSPCTDVDLDIDRTRELL